MPWEFIIVPIIAVAVWIIGTLLRGAEKPPGRNGAAPRRPERVADLDRFLREVHRRRQGQDSTAPAERRQESEPPPVRRVPRPQAIPVVLPVDEVVVVPEPALAPVLRTVEAPPLPSVPSDKPARSRPPQPEAAALRGLLRSREGLRTAMVLQEVFGPPLSRRRRR